MGILGVIPRPRRLHLAGRLVELVVPVATLGAVADIEAAVRDSSWDPWDVPPDAFGPFADPALRWEYLWYRSHDWPPEPHTPFCEQAIGPDVFATAILHILAGRHNGLGPAESAELAVLMSPWDWACLSAAAYDCPPIAMAARQIDRLGGIPFPASGGGDWGDTVAKWCRDKNRLPAEAEALTLTEWRAVRGVEVDADPYLRARKGETRGQTTTRRRETRERAAERVDAWEQQRNGGSK